jgi:hypothetical protein
MAARMAHHSARRHCTTRCTASAPEKGSHRRTTRSCSARRQGRTLSSASRQNVPVQSDRQTHGNPRANTESAVAVAAAGGCSLEFWRTARGR